MGRAKRPQDPMKKGDLLDTTGGQLRVCHNLEKKTMGIPIYYSVEDDLSYPGNVVVKAGFRIEVSLYVAKALLDTAHGDHLLKTKQALREQICRGLAKHLVEEVTS